MISIGLGAIDQLLLGELEQVTLLDLNHSLDIGNGRESPAGTALSLILHRVDGSLGNPIDAWRIAADLLTNLDLIIFRSCSESVASHLGFELLDSHISESVQLHGVGGVALVVGLHTEVVLVENGESVEQFSWG